MTRRSTPPANRPSPFRISLAFVVGTLLAVVLVAPALPTVADKIDMGSATLDPVGRTLIGGALAVLLVTFGLWALYQVFVLVDN